MARQGLTLKRVAFLVREEAASERGAYSSAHEQLVCKWRAGKVIPNPSHQRREVPRACEVLSQAITIAVDQDLREQFENIDDVRCRHLASCAQEPAVIRLNEELHTASKEVFPA
jgi:hypothetical protein